MQMNKIAQKVVPVAELQVNGRCLVIGVMELGQQVNVVRMLFIFIYTHFVWFRKQIKAWFLFSTL